MPNQTRLPIGFSPGQKRRAPDSLTTATGGLPARSAGVSAPPGEDRNAQRPEVVGRDVVPADARRVRAIGRPIREEQRRARAAAERRAAIDRRRFDAGHGLDAREQAIHCRRARGRRIARARRPHPERQHVVGDEAGAAALDAREALDQQSGCGEQQARDRHFADDQDRERAAAAAAAALVLLERRHQIRPRRRERRHQREQQRGASATASANSSTPGSSAGAPSGRGRRSCCGRSRSPPAPSARRCRRPTRRAACRRTPAIAAITSLR